MGKSVWLIVLSGVAGAIVSVIVLKLLGVDTTPPIIAAAVGAAVGSTVHSYAQKKQEPNIEASNP